MARGSNGWRHDSRMRAGRRGPAPSQPGAASATIGRMRAGRRGPAPSQPGAASATIGRMRARTRGSALTEFALVVPLLSALLYGALYLTELGHFKLKAQEIARYGAWSFTGRALSDYDGELRHRDAYQKAQRGVRDELTRLYLDLDGAVARPSLGAAAQTTGAVYQPPSSTSFRHRPTQLVPEWANPSWADDLSIAGFILNLIGLGTDLDSMFGRIGNQLGLNARGQITVRADVRLTTANQRPKRRKVARALRRQGAGWGLDLSRWEPEGLRLRDAGARPIQTTLVADSWRVQQGAAALPSYPEHPLSQVVKHMNDGVRVFGALPGGNVLGPLIGFISNINLPGGLTRIFAIPPNAPEAHIFARPYTERRQLEPSPGGRLRRGQVDIFEQTGAARPPNGAVRNFETAPAYTDPHTSDGSGFVRSLNERGPNFMGCPDAEVRGCFD